MPRDISTKSSKREQIKRFSKKDEADRKKKKNEESDSDNGESSDSEDEEMNIHEFRKYIQKIFPSKHMDNKIKSGEKLKKITEEVESPKKKSKYNKKVVEEEDWETDSEEEYKTSKNCKHNKQNKNNKHDNNDNKNNKKAKKIDVSDDESISLGSEDTENIEDDEDTEDDEDEDEDEEYEEETTGKPSKVNIIFTIGGTSEDEDEWDEYDEDFEDEEDYDKTEDEDEEVSTDESSDEESYEDENEDEDEELKRNNKKSIHKKSNSKDNKNKDNKSKDNKEKQDKDKQDKEDKNQVLQELKELLSKNPNDKSIQKCIEVYKADVNLINKKKEKKEKKQKAKNMRIFRKIISDKNSMNDFTFYEKLDTDNQNKLIKELREINKITRIEKPYRMTLLESDMPVLFKAAAFKKVNSLKYMEPGSGEFYKIKNWVDTFMKIPFTNYKSLPISIENGVESCHEFMSNAQKTLDEAVYGLNDAKMQIMQMLGQLLTNPKAIGTAIAIHGPPGTGKTSLVKEGISKILNRPFAFIALGGATDSSFLEGHGYTYEGSTWGKIVQILIDSKCMNPVIYFDELDKISDTPRGEEIAGILTHLTDTSQNSQFHDKYFAEIDFDLSKCLFIFSYNDESKVNPILKDRMYRIKTKGYSGKEKTAISNNYLLPKIREQVKFNDDDIIIPDDVLSYINETHCNKEDGVRNMKRCLEIIHTKLNLYRLMKPGANLFEGEMSLKVEFPFKITKDIVDKLIKKEEQNMSALYSMYV
jgi:ATP-dependent Lon protease